MTIPTTHRGLAKFHRGLRRGIEQGAQRTRHDAGKLISRAHQNAEVIRLAIKRRIETQWDEE